MVEDSSYPPWARELHDHYHQGGKEDEEASDCREVVGVVEGWLQHTIGEVDLKGRVVLDYDGIGKDGQTHQAAREEQEEDPIADAAHEEDNGEEIGGESNPVRDGGEWKGNTLIVNPLEIPIKSLWSFRSIVH